MVKSILLVGVGDRVQFLQVIINNGLMEAGYDVK